MKPKLIDKDALVAEIKRRIILLENNSNGIIIMLASGMFVNEYKDLLSFLDTVEVKEVDLDKELDFVKDAYYYFTSDERSSMKKVAEHFFELGMSVSNKAQKGE